ncbi:galactose mutarotase [Afifella sp. JA880]|uniref:aldose epimerase family protein n=1 Tax=Afifella sp. JA880 TaxID=2975280 RepID=UPI0021BABE6B|nr:aldose epimerase family protein [Afifella sp. JA880]MCT8266551.1 galactose mutarotase [Afifella sp. JA880]
MEAAGTRRVFGMTPEGQTIEAVTIAAGELSADIITYGAILRDLRLLHMPHPLVLGFCDLDGYLNTDAFLGATAGRVGNRIAGGRFTLDGREIELDVNDPPNHLHGGKASFGRRPWRIMSHDETSVILGLVSRAGESGYPGTVEVTCRFELLPPATLRITYLGRTDEPTLLNLLHHSYFNLSGADDILDHSLMIPAQSYLPANENEIPTGEVRGVEGTPYDFRKRAKIAERRGSEKTVYDANFCLAEHRHEDPRHAASVWNDNGELEMQVWTTEPGIQLYDGYKLDLPVKGLEGRPYGAHAGLCLEPQLWPDAPNHEGFPSAVLRPGETYRQVTEFHFRHDPVAE